MERKEVLETLQKVVDTLELQWAIIVEDEQTKDVTLQIDKDNCLLYGRKKRLFDVADIKSIGYDIAPENAAAQTAKRIIIERVNGDKLYIVWGTKKQELYVEEAETKCEKRKLEFEVYIEQYHTDRVVMHSARQTLLKYDFENISNVPEEKYKEDLGVLDRIIQRFIERSHNRAMIFSYCDVAILKKQKYEYFSKEKAFSMLKKYNLAEDYSDYFEEKWKLALDEEELQREKMDLIEKLLCE